MQIVTEGTSHLKIGFVQKVKEIEIIPPKFKGFVLF